MQTPLAWKNLTSSRSKCALAATGVGFAVVLMFMQIGFRGALIDNNVQLFSLFDTDQVNLCILSRARYNVSTEQRFPRRVLESAATMPGVKSSTAVSLERGTAKVQIEGFTARPIRVIGIELNNAAAFESPELFAALHAAQAIDAGLVDSRSKPSYGFAQTPAELSQQHIELNGRELPIIGQFKLGTDFGNDGSLLLGQRTAAKYFPWRSPSGDPADLVDLGLLEVDTRQVDDLSALASRIQALAPKQIRVRTTAEVIQSEKDFWANNTPIGKIFFIGTIMGLVVGAIICYQIQFTDITEHMPEFATLKAMGYGPRYFWSVVLCQSLYLACLGFLPGMLVSWLLYQMLAEFSGLLMILTWERILTVWLLTLGMCIVSGALAIRKLFNSDPASLF